MDTQTLRQLAPIFGAIGLAIALAILFFLKRMPVASQDMAELGEKIHRGAMVFLRRSDIAYRLRGDKWGNNCENERFFVSTVTI